MDVNMVWVDVDVDVDVGIGYGNGFIVFLSICVEKGRFLSDTDYWWLLKNGLMLFAMYC